MVIGCVGTGYVLRVELTVQRRLCPIFVRDVGSPDIHECFRGLTGSQRTPRIWGVTEVEYPEWLANVVLVKKANGKWQLCIDFTDINRACPKDSFPLPRIDLIVEATAGHELLSFMDAFSGYNQINMDPDDQEKTSFVTGKGTYCYRVMPFGLKNTGATYQRLVNRMFHKQIGASMEVYIDDMLVKSTSAKLHIAHLSEAFQILREYNMKLIQPNALLESQLKHSLVL